MNITSENIIGMLVNYYNGTDVKELKGNKLRLTIDKSKLIVAPEYVNNHFSMNIFDDLSKGDTIKTDDVMWYVHDFGCPTTKFNASDIDSYKRIDVSILQNANRIVVTINIDKLKKKRHESLITRVIEHTNGLAFKSPYRLFTLPYRLFNFNYVRYFLKPVEICDLFNSLSPIEISQSDTNAFDEFSFQHPQVNDNIIKAAFASACNLKGGKVDLDNQDVKQQVIKYNKQYNGNINTDILFEFKTIEQIEELYSIILDIYNVKGFASNESLKSIEAIQTIMIRERNLKIIID